MAPEVATGRRLGLLRAGLVVALCGAAIGFFALAAAVAGNPRAGVYLAGGILPVVRNVAGMSGIGMIFCLATGRRGPADQGGWIAALVVFAAGLIAFTVRGPRVRQSGELRPAVGARSSVRLALARRGGDQGRW